MLFETYAKRKKAAERAGQPDVYQYDEVPPFLRKQVAMILVSALGPWYEAGAYDTHFPKNGNASWQRMAGILERETEHFPHRGSSYERCMSFMQTAATDDWLSMVEIACRLLSFIDENTSSDRHRHEHGATQNADEALEELNARFREAGFGYEFQSRNIIRIDEQFVHSEVVKPALALLATPGFGKADEDFLIAHRHYRDGNTKDAIVAANRAFESTLKAICTARQWDFPPGARATDLVSLVKNKGLFPPYLDEGLSTYIAMMKTGLPGVRNKAGGHGEAPAAPPVPGYVASYAIHLTAANIVLLMNAHNGST